MAMNREKKIEVLQTAILEELQVQHYNESMEYWENIQDLEHQVEISIYSYRLIVDGDILIHAEQE